MNGVQLAYQTIQAGPCEVDTQLGTVRFGTEVKLIAGPHGELMAELDGHFAGMFSPPWRVRPL